ncbi:MAG: DUF4279 domain-containing protein [Mesorhizobium sp.]
MATVIATCATLRLFGDDLEPGEITRLLGCQPSAGERRGEAKGPRRDNMARTGGWRLSSEREDGDQLSRQIRDILSRTSGDAALWDSLRGRYRIDMFCGVWLDEAGQGLAINPMVLSELGMRGIPLELDIYYPDVDQPVTK